MLTQWKCAIGAFRKETAQRKQITTTKRYLGMQLFYNENLKRLTVSSVS